MRIPDDEVNLCPDELPEGFVNWVRFRIIAEDRTLIYKKGNIRGICGVCGRTVRADSYSGRFRQGYCVQCPDCGAEVMCVLENSALWKADYVENVALLQRDERGVAWIRQFHVIRDNTAEYSRPLIGNYLSECARYVFRDGHTAMWTCYAKENSWIGRCYEYKLGFWSRSKKLYIYDGSYRFFTNNVEDEVKGTALAYADLLNYIHFADYPNVIKYAMKFTQYPVTEFLQKKGYRQLVYQLVHGLPNDARNCILWKRNKLSECFKIPLSWLKRMDAEKLSAEELARWNRLYEKGADFDEAKWFVNNVHYLADYSVLKYASGKQAVTYLKKAFKDAFSSKKEKQSDVMCEYDDYIRMCEEMEYDLTDKNNLFPKDLYKAHDNIALVLKLKANKEKDEKIKAISKKLEKLTFKSNGYLIRPARSATEIITEGEKNHHCVGTYVDRVIQGTTAIFFVRRLEDPDKVYFTLELRNKRIVQCRTKNNRSYENEKDVFAFCEKWLNEVVNKNERKAKVNVGNSKTA